MILEDHNGPGLPSRVQATRGIGDDGGPYPEQGQDPDREADFPGRIALIIMEASLEDGTGPASQGTVDQITGMAGHRGAGKAGDLLIRDRDAVVHGLDQIAQTSAQLNQDLGHGRETGTKKGHSAFYLLFMCIAALHHSLSSLLSSTYWQASASRAATY